HAVPTPIFEYRFNEVGVAAASTGSDHTPVTFYNSSNFITDLHTASGVGVSGQTGDRAFNNTASTAMGGTGTGGIARTDTNPPALTGLTALTITGWYKTDGSSVPNDKARLVIDSDGLNNEAFQLGGGDIT